MTGQRSAWPASALTLVATVAAAAGVAWAIAHGGAEWLGRPVVVWCAALVFGVQWLAFVPSYLARNEHAYDLVGSLTYITVTLFALVATGLYDLRSLVIAALVLIWAGRLGTFLFRRVRKAGGDGRFDQIKQSAPRFLVAWTLQGLWVFLTSAAALAAITVPQRLGTGLTVEESSGTGATGVELSDLDVMTLVGLLVWLVGFLIEVLADRQKSAFKRDPRNEGRFITTGLWSWSRHPNYFGEIVLWIGIGIIATPTLEGWRWLAWISPVFVTLLLTRISGVPMLERRARKRWGDDPAYQRYVERTPVLVPRPPRG